MQVKGLEMGGYLAQTSPPRGLQYAVGDRGGCHHYGLDIAEQNFRTWVDSLTICSWHRPFVSREVYPKVLNGATGWDLKDEDWNIIAERILIMARVYNIREGMRREGNTNRRTSYQSGPGIYDSYVKRAIVLGSGMNEGEDAGQTNYFFLWRDGCTHQ